MIICHEKQSKGRKINAANSKAVFAIMLLVCYKSRGQKSA
jgi:hypothetical protein